MDPRLASLLVVVPLGAAAPVPVGAPPSDPSAELTAEQVARALDFMKDASADKRRGAFAALRKLGESQRGQYAELLGKARAFHDDALGDKALDLLILYATGPNTLGLGTNGKHWTLNTGTRP